MRMTRHRTLSVPPGAEGPNTNTHSYNYTGPPGQHTTGLDIPGLDQAVHGVLIFNTQ